MIALSRLFRFLTALLALKVVGRVVVSYGDYFPANFGAEFLLGRESLFHGAYEAAFYTHIISGPIALLLGVVLLNEGLLRRWPKWHRRLGRVQAMNILLLVTPSGLIMARHAIGGPVAGVGFALLAIATATCVALGWRAAVQRRFRDHRVWMERCFALLASAIVIRALGGLATVAEFGPRWLDVALAWTSWITPLLALELYRAMERQAGIMKAISKISQPQ